MRINHDINGGSGKAGPSLFICSPSYSGDFNCHFVTSLLQTTRILEEKKIPYTIYFSVYDSLVARSRNDLVDNFLKTDCTHILMIDADQGWTPEAVPNMLSLDKDCLTAAVISRKPNAEEYAIKIDTNQDMTPLVNDQGLIKCSSNGVAFAMIKREVFETIKADNPYNQSVYPYFQHFYGKDGSHYGEDTYFINEWNKIGETWIYPDITFKHGTNEGNYHEFLLKQPKPENDSRVIIHQIEPLFKVGVN